MKNFILALAGSGLFVLFSSPAVLLAAETDSAENQTPIEIIITSGRKQQATDDVLAANSVVTRQSIERSQAQTLGEVLSQLPGITLGNTGGMGKQTSVYLRGSNSDHVLVLIDGVQVGSATLGSTAFEFLPVAQIERIELIRGPRSALYGSEAIAGVIQIFTRQGTKDGFTPRASLSYGSNNTRQADVNLSGGNGRSWYNFNAATERTDGFNALDFYQSFPPPDYSPVKVFETDDDGFSNDSFSIRAGHEFGNGTRAEISALHSSGDTDFDGGFQNESDFVQQVITAKLNTKLSENTGLAFQIGQSRDESDNFLNGTYSSSFNTKRNTASIQANSDLNHGGLVYGIDFQQDKVSGSVDYDEDSRDNTGLFVSYATRLGANSIEVALRGDDNDSFGQHTTGNIAFGHELGNGLKLKAGYGTAFKAPTFNDLYWPDDGSFSGNPNLDPEQSRTFELGISGTMGQGGWEANIFDTRVDDLISYVYNAETFSGTMENVDEAKIQGIELEARQRFAGWTMAANATWLDTENLTGFNKGESLTRRPDKVLNLSADRQFGPLQLGMSVRAESDRYMDAANTDRLGGFTTVDVRGKYQLAKDWAVSAKVANLFDKAYETVRNYNQDGINGLITLEYQPQ